MLEEGAQITATADPKPGAHAFGHVTSAYFSPATGRSIAFALIELGRRRLGEQFYCPMPGGARAVTAVDMVFFDKEGARLNA